MSELQNIVIRAFLVLLLAGCAGHGSIKNTGSIDASWAGVWRGKAMIENTLSLPRVFVLDIVYTSTHIKAYYSDPRAGIEQLQVRKLFIEDDSIRFAISYETPHSIFAVMSFSGKRIGDDLMITFEGSRGGRDFMGKWQANHISSKNLAQHKSTP